MTEQFLSTSRLGNVIQLIALGKQTGVLKAMRGLGSTREQGEVHFMNGQPTYAVLGQMIGNAALTVLQNWGESQYLFLEGPLPEQGQSPFQSDPFGHMSDHPAPQTGPFGARPTQRFSPTPTRQMAGFPSYTASLPMNPGQGGNNTTGNLSYRGNDSFFSGPLSPLPTRREALQGQFIPRRLASMDRLENLPLDRRERMVLLLVDGRRSLADLVRLTRRSEQELQAILSHLAALRLIE
ncbi:MAG TPA: DUF4388 domain-containing protein [Ktedonobacterales bacterium]|jgi:hypothetical protein